MAKISLPALVLSLLLLANSAFAGLVQTERDGTVVLIADGKLKSLPHEKDEGYLIFDSRGDLTFVNPANHTYGAGTVDEYCQVMGAMAEAIAQAMGSAPQARKSSVRIDKKSKEKIAGYETTHYAVLIDGKPYEELWISSDPELVGEFGRFDKLAEMMACANPTAMGAKPENDPAYRKLVTSGLVLKEIDQEGEVVTDVVRIEKKKIAPAEFEPPNGYKKTSLPKMFGGM